MIDLVVFERLLPNAEEKKPMIENTTKKSFAKDCKNEMVRTRKDNKSPNK